VLIRRALGIRLDEIMEEEAARFLATVPFAAHLTDDSEPLCEAYYIRHRIETVARIRLTSRTDALALARMVEQDYEAARVWSRYICEELDHDRIFLEDLARHGWSAEAVLATAPLPATVRLLQFLDDRLVEVGPLSAVAYSIFVEWNSERYSPRAVGRAAARFSPAHVAGAASHTGIDAAEDHYESMVDVAERLLRPLGDHRVLEDLIRRIAALFREYFTELYELTAPKPVAMARRPS
jgi:hypothetical protein